MNGRASGRKEIASTRFDNRYLWSYKPALARLLRIPATYRRGEHLRLLWAHPQNSSCLNSNNFLTEIKIPVVFMR
jgi:hypothetical protein